MAQVSAIKRKGTFENFLRSKETGKNSLLVGVYEGKWTAYHVEWSTPNGDFEGETEIGVRGRNCPCIVTVTESGTTVKVG